jgi:Sec-independent protein translocase protein TatA
MLSISWSEILVILFVAIIVSNPKDIPSIISSFKDFIKKINKIKQEVVKVIGNFDDNQEIASIKKDLEEEVALINSKITQIVDNEGNVYDAYDISELKSFVKNPKNNDTNE